MWRDYPMELDDWWVRRYSIGWLLTRILEGARILGLWKFQIDWCRSIDLSGGFIDVATDWSDSGLRTKNSNSTLLSTTMVVDGNTSMQLLFLECSDHPTNYMCCLTLESNTLRPGTYITLSRCILWFNLVRISMVPIPLIGHQVDPSPRITYVIGSVYGRMEMNRCFVFTMWWFTPLSRINFVIDQRTSPWCRFR